MDFCSTFSVLPNNGWLHGTPHNIVRKPKQAQAHKYRKPHYKASSYHFKRYIHANRRRSTYTHFISTSFTLFHIYTFTQLYTARNRDEDRHSRLNVEYTKHTNTNTNTNIYRHKLIALLCLAIALVHTNQIQSFEIIRTGSERVCMNFENRCDPIHMYVQLIFNEHRRL